MTDHADAGHDDIADLVNNAGYGAQLSAQLEPFDAALAAQVEATQANAETDIFQQPEATVILGAYDNVQRIAFEWTQRQGALNTDRQLSPEGHAAKSQQLRQQMAERIDAEVTKSEGQAQILAQNVGREPSEFRATGDLSAEATLAAAMWQHKTARTRTEEVTKLLAVAMHPKMPESEHRRANTLLQAVYLPLLQKTVEAPEKWMRPLLPQATKLAELIATHLRIRTGTVRHDAARDVAAQLHHDVKWTARETVKTGTWDKIPMQVAAPTIGKLRTSRPK